MLGSYQSCTDCARVEVLPTVWLKIQGYWVATLCLVLLYPKDGGGNIVRNVETPLPNDTP
jgi:hypothetical protein